MAVIPASSAAITSSLSAIRPPASTGTLAVAHTRRRILGMVPGSRSRQSGRFGGILSKLSSAMESSRNTRRMAASPSSLARRTADYSDQRHRPAPDRHRQPRRRAPAGGRCAACRDLDAAHIHRRTHPLALCREEGPRRRPPHRITKKLEKLPHPRELFRVPFAAVKGSP